MNRRRFLGLSLAAGALALVPGSARAQSGLDAAKQAGLVGERPDGLVGVVGGSAPADVVALVERVNAERRARYEQIAAETNATLEAVQAVAGAQLIDRTPAGQYIMTAGGKWMKK